MKMSLVAALDLMAQGLANGNVAAVRRLLTDLRPQAVEIEARASADISRLDWLESRTNVTLSRHDSCAYVYNSPPCSAIEGDTIREAIDKARNAYS